MALRLGQLFRFIVSALLFTNVRSFTIGLRPAVSNKKVLIQSARKSAASDVQERCSDQWEELNGGCKILWPKENPRAVVHFLGGAFVSPQPTVAYRYVLERLAEKGYAVVATPFAVDFNYMKPAGDIRDRFKLAREELEGRGYGSVPLLAMGHSLGALMHVLLACEFPDEYAEGVVGAALISYNNKEVEGAIPAFKEVVVPAFSPLEPLTRDEGIKETVSRLQEARATGFDAARSVARDVRDRLGLREGESLIPGVKPILLEALDDLEAATQLVDQLPDVVSSIAQGASQFEPTPTEMREKVSLSYTIPSPLVVKFGDDFIDESNALMDILPKERVDAKLEVLTGTHVTPLAIDPNAPSTPLLPIPDALADGRSALLSDADALVDVLEEYFSESIADAESVAMSSSHAPPEDELVQSQIMIDEIIGEDEESAVE